MRWFVRPFRCDDGIELCVDPLGVQQIEQWQLGAYFAAEIQMVGHLCCHLLGAHMLWFIVSEPSVSWPGVDQVVMTLWSSVAPVMVILRGLARSVRGISRRSTPRS